jgi:pantoate--beta-alanine ligase
MPLVIETAEELKKYLTNHGGSIGFVPTMGALHNGHKTLIDKARTENNLVIVSIFVNPTQFLEGEDFSKYPRTFDKDFEICRIADVDIIFLPKVNEIYNKDDISILAPIRRGYILEGFSRAGHFNGVLTVVFKLFNIVKPHRAYFGKKDAQQLILIQQMVRDLYLDIKIIPIDIVRDRDGLALSSRNIYLSEIERISARAIPNSLLSASRLIMSGERNIYKIESKIKSELIDLKIDYVAILKRDLTKIDEVEMGNSIILIACKVGGVRLIDNLWI